MPCFQQRIGEKGGARFVRTLRHEFRLSMHMDGPRRQQLRKLGELAAIAAGKHHRS
jgi:hypothetical protein